MSRFVYGSLMAPEVLQALLGRVPDRTEATVRGYQRQSIKGRVYPALIRCADTDARVRGELIRGMSRREIAVLDWFEDEAYVPTRVEVETDAGATETVTCYLWDDSTLLEGEWSFERFLASHLAGYVELCEAFREDVRNNDLPSEEEEEEEEMSDG